MLPGFNQHCRELMCLAQGHNMVLRMGIEPRTSRFGVGRSTTTPPCSLKFGYKKKMDYTICVVTAKMLISCAVTAQLICALFSPMHVVGFLIWQLICNYVSDV